MNTIHNASSVSSRLIFIAFLLIVGTDSRSCTPAGILWGWSGSCKRCPVSLDQTRECPSLYLYIWAKLYHTYFSSLGFWDFVFGDAHIYLGLIPTSTAWWLLGRWPRWDQFGISWWIVSDRLVITLVSMGQWVSSFVHWQLGVMLELFWF